MITEKQEHVLFYNCIEISRKAQMAIDEMEKGGDAYLKKKEINKVLREIRENLREIEEVWK